MAIVFSIACFCLLLSSYLYDYGRIAPASLLHMPQLNVLGGQATTLLILCLLGLGEFALPWWEPLAILVLVAPLVGLTAGLLPRTWQPIRLSFPLGVALTSMLFIMLANA